MWKKWGRSGGNATIEFTLVGIPLVFILISTIEMARGMWIYHTLAYAIKEGTRYTIGRGQNSPTPATHHDVCNAIVQASTGLLPEELLLTFHSATTPDKPPVKASDCLQDSTRWPPGDNLSVVDNQPGQTITITGFYPFVSAISMFWPGAGQGMQFNKLTCQGPQSLCLPASSEDVMQF